MSNPYTHLYKVEVKKKPFKCNLLENCNSVDCLYLMKC